MALIPRKINQIKAGLKVSVVRRTPSRLAVMEKAFHWRAKKIHPPDVLRLDQQKIVLGGKAHPGCVLYVKWISDI